RSRSDPPYAVGYGNPPQATQFKPGQSGNPGGRPKGSKNFASLIESELNKRIDIAKLQAMYPANESLGAPRRRDCQLPVLGADLQTAASIPIGREALSCRRVSA